MNNITVTTELCQEDRNRLDTLIAIGLELCKKNVYDVQPVAPAETQQNDAEPASDPAPETGHPVDAALPWGEPASEAPAEEPVKEVTVDELLALVQKLVAPGTGKREKARAIVHSYGASKVSGVPADKRAECMGKLIELDKAVVE